MNVYVKLVRIVLGTSLMLFYGCPLVAGLPGQPPLSGEIDKLMSDPAFQQEMERMNKMIESDPALQAEVNKLLDDPEFQQAMNQMFEDPAFQEELAKELQRMPTPPAPGEPGQPYQPVPSKPVEPVKKEEPKKPTRDITPAIDEINVRLENFMQRMAQYPDMASNFEKWSKKKRIQLSGGLTWDAFKVNVEKLKKSLYEIKAVDIKTQKPKYLNDLAANEGLCNNLEKFRTDLARHEPGIVVKLGKKVTKESKSAIVNVINACLSAISVLKIQDELEKIIIKYDPIAKKLKEDEEKKEKTAVASAQRRQAQPAPMRVSMRGGPEAQGYYQEGLPGGDRGRGAFGPYQPGGYPGRPYGEPAKPSKHETGAGKKPEDKKKEEPKKAEAPKKEDEKKSAAEEQVSKLYDDVQKKLGEQIDLMTEELGNPQALFSLPPNDRKYNEGLKTLESITSSLRTLGRSTLRYELRQLIHFDLSGSRKSDWIKMFAELWSENRPEFEKFQKKLKSINDPAFKNYRDEFDSALSSLATRFADLKTKPRVSRKPKHPVKPTDKK